MSGNSEVFQSGVFHGVSVNDAFAQAALQESPQVFKLAPFTWPTGLKPAEAQLGNLAPGAKVTGPADFEADVLVLLYTEQEISAFLEVFLGKSGWTATDRASWSGYAHNFAQYDSSILNKGADGALVAGEFGYLKALTVGTKKVVLYKSDLHPKGNGPAIPFIPVIAQLISELKPKLVVSTGTAGAVGSHLACGDVIVVNSARVHLQKNYADFATLDALNANATEMTNTVTIDPQYIQYAALNYTQLSLPGLANCYRHFAGQPQYSFLKPNPGNPAIYVAGVNDLPGSQPMAIVSADYLTVDDDNDSEGLQSLGAMNDTDDAFAFYAIENVLSGPKPQWLSIRNASEPQVAVPPFPPGTTPTQIVDNLKGLAGAIYGVFQFCTTINSAFACWGAIAGLQP